MVFYDPLGNIKFPYFNQEVVAFSLNSGLRALPYHFHEILISFTFYTLTYVFSKLFSPYLVKSYNTLSKRNQINFNVHVVSMVQCVIILGLSAPLFNDPVLSKDRVDGYTPYCGFVISMATGYFIWDVLICIRYYNLFGFGFLLHGAGALLVFIQGLRPFTQYYAPIFLLFEASTPFVNIHWFAGHLSEGSIPEWVQKINGLILIIVFPAVRILWGFYQAARLAQDILKPSVRLSHPTWIAVSLLVSNILLDTLNVYWYYKMIAAVKRRLKMAKEASLKKSEKKMQ